MLRLLAVIIWIGWIGSWGSAGFDSWPVTSQSLGEGWLSGENLADLVVHYAHRPPFWPSTGSCSRGQCRGRKKPPSSWPRATVKARSQGKVKPQSSLLETETAAAKDVFAPHRWGLSPDMSRELPERLHELWLRYADCFTTRTRDTSSYAYHYLSGLLRIETRRNYTQIGRGAGIASENIQHFMSNSPWLAQTVLAQLQQEVKATPGLERGSVLLLDESADKKAGDKTAGAGRQWNGRLGKVDMSQVGTFLAYANLTEPQRPLWTWVDGELFLQEQWFTPEREERRQRVGIPPQRTFATKIELGWKMIQRVKAAGLSFEAVAFDEVYGRNPWLRDQVAGAGMVYIADVPRTTTVYLEKPLLGVPERPAGQRGRKPTRLRVLNGVEPVQVHQVVHRSDTTWKQVRVRPIERGQLNDPFAARRVWTLREEDPEPVEDWLLIRREAPNRYSYALSNAPANASLQTLAWLKCQRYFVERANQDAKSEAGWDELQAQKYRGWEHHLVLTILATWFVAQVKREWASPCRRDPTLAQQLGVDTLDVPTLSMANIRLLLRAAMPLPQPTAEQAVSLIAQQLVNRTRSRSSRLKRQRLATNAQAPP